MRKGQVTVFIILGIVIVAVVIFFLFLKNKLSSEKLPDLGDAATGIAEVDKITAYSGQCFNNIIDESIKDVLQQGGYFSLDNLSSRNIDKYSIPYYLKDSNTYVPTEEQVYESLRLMIIKNFDECTDGYSAFDKLDVIIEKGDTSVTIVAKEGTVIELNPEVDINYENTIYSSKSITKFLTLNITPVLKSAQEIVDVQKDFEAGYLSMTDLQKITAINNVNFNVFGVDDTTALLVLTNNGTYENALYSMIDLS